MPYQSDLIVSIAPTSIAPTYLLMYSPASDTTTT